MGKNGYISKKNSLEKSKTVSRKNFKQFPNKINEIVLQKAG